jgi:ribosomal protein S18 acetylase RimI-like enzyme
MNLIITEFDNKLHSDRVITLWKDVFGYEAEHNAPELVIRKKLEFGDDLFFVALRDQLVIGTIMAGYDGHRGWIYSMAVSPKYQSEGIGSSLLGFVERKLSELGCMKINLQIVEGNELVENFYIANGYHTEKRISMGKRLPENINNNH